MLIPVRIEQSLGIARLEEALVAGLPMARGQVTETGWMTLRHEGGQAWPVSTSAAAYWPDGSVKWLHLCGRVSLDEAAAHELALDTTLLGEEGRPHLTVEPQGKGISVTGGAVEVALGADVQGWLHARAAGASGGVSGEAEGVRIEALLPELEYVGPEAGDAPRRTLCAERRTGARGGGDGQSGGAAHGRALAE